MALMHTAQLHHLGEQREGGGEIYFAIFGDF